MGGQGHASIQQQLLKDEGCGAFDKEAEAMYRAWTDAAAGSQPSTCQPHVHAHSRSGMACLRAIKAKKECACECVTLRVCVYVCVSCVCLCCWC